MSRRPWRRGKKSDLDRADDEAVKLRKALVQLGMVEQTGTDPMKESEALERSLQAVARVRAFQDRASTQPAVHKEAHPRSLAARIRLNRPVISGGLIAALAAILLNVLAIFPGGTAPASAATPPPLEFTNLTLSTRLGSAPAAAETLIGLSRRSQDAPSVDAAAGYVLTTVGWDAAYLIESPEAEGAVLPFRTTWTVDSDGSTTREQRRGTPLTPDGREISASDELAGPVLQVDRLPAGTVDTRLIETLPRDPILLRASLLESGGCPTENIGKDFDQNLCLMTAIVDLYSNYPVPTQIQSAIWAILSMEPEVRLAGTGEDRSGRPCVAVALEIATEGRVERWILMADPNTGRMLGVDRALVEGDLDGLRAPVVLSFSSFIGVNSLT